jgi:hypothetical protein
MDLLGPAVALMGFLACSVKSSVASPGMSIALTNRLSLSRVSSAGSIDGRAGREDLLAATDESETIGEVSSGMLGIVSISLDISNGLWDDK